MAAYVVGDVRGLDEGIPLIRLLAYLRGGHLEEIAALHHEHGGQASKEDARWQKRVPPRGDLGFQGLTGNAAAATDEEAQSRQDEHEVVAVEVEHQANRKEREERQAQYGGLF